MVRLLETNSPKPPRRLIVRKRVGSLLRLLPRDWLLRSGNLLRDEALYTFPNNPAINGERELVRMALETCHDARAIRVLDVGANAGQWAQILVSELALRPELRCEVHAFEPVDTARQRLERFVADLPDRFHFSISASAVSSSPGEAIFYIRGDGLGISSMYEAEGSDGVATVAVTTIDDYASSSELDEIDLIKVDAEGHDFEVIQGAKSLLRHGRVSFLQFEYNWRWIDARRYLRDVFELLEALPYALGKVTPSGLVRLHDWWPELETYRESNYVLVRDDLVELVPFVASANR